MISAGMVGQKSRITSLAAALLLAMTPLGALAQKADSPANTKKAANPNAFPRIWKSKVTPHEYRVRIEKDTFYAEWVNRSAAAVQQGLYIRSECHRVGDKWVGTSHARLACSKDKSAGTKGENLCSMTLRFEVNSITPEKITGRGETLKSFDCGKCQVLQTGWGDFVWVPK